MEYNRISVTVPGLSGPSSSNSKRLDSLLKVNAFTILPRMRRERLLRDGNTEEDAIFLLLFLLFLCSVSVLQRYF